MSLTKGLGEYWGNYLISEPFKFRLIKWIKKIIKKFIRYIPWKRKRFTFKIRMTGDVFYPKHVLMTVPIRGERDLFPLLWLILEDEEDE